MHFVIFAVLFAVGLITYSVAHAQTETQVIVGELIQPWLEMLFSAAIILITALIGWLTAMIKRKTGIEVEAAHREALQTALTNGAGLILNKIGAHANTVTFDAKHPAIKAGVEYVIASVPDAVGNFELKPEQLAEKLVAKLGLAQAAATPLDPTK